MNKFKYLLSTTSFIFIISITSLDVVSQETARSSSLIEEVITTARKKEENQQVVPISITTVSSEQIEV